MKGWKSDKVEYKREEGKRDKRLTGGYEQQGHIQEKKPESEGVGG